MYTVKPEFTGLAINYNNKKVTLNEKLSEKEVNAMVTAGLGRYFVDNPTIENEPLRHEAKVIKMGAKGAEIAAGLEAGNKPKAKASVKVPYNKQKNEDLIAQITERKLEIGTATTKAELVAILEADDASNA